MKIIFKIITITVLISLIISIIILASVPPVSKDALTHHLVVPKLYLIHGGVYEIPEISFSYYPMILDLLYMIPLSMGNDIVPKYIHFGFALLTAGLIFNYLRRRLNNLSAFTGSLYFLSIPIIVKLSITVYVDLGLIFFSTASLIYLLKWGEYPDKLRYLILSGVWCGLAMGTKYNGLISCFLLSLFVPFVYLGSIGSSVEDDACGSKLNTQKVIRNRGAKPQFQAVFYGALFVGVAVIVFSPWMIKNTIWTGNPVYPLFNSYLKTKASNISQSKGDNVEKNIGDKINKKTKTINHFVLRKILYKETWWQTVLIPLRVFFSGRDGTPKYFDGKLNPFLCILPIFAFIGRRKDSSRIRTEKKMFFLFSALYLFTVFLNIDMRIRWIAPIIPPLVILSVYGLNEIVGFAAEKVFFNKITHKQFLFIIIAGFIFLPNIRYMVEQFKYVAPLSYLTGDLDRDQYIEKYRPEYPVIKYANENLPEHIKIYSIFLGMRRYYSDRELVFFNSSEFLGIVRRADTPNIIKDELLKKGMTHVIVGYDMLDSWANINLDSRQKRILTQFFQGQTNLVFSNSKYGLYAL